MELVQAFNAELSSLYEVKPPISKAKMSQITKVAIKGIKMYKHIVQSVERFIAKCRPEYKIPGLYVIDSIVRQSRHQFGAEKDVFGPRFTRNFNQTFQNLFLTCPQEDKPKIVRVLNLWQRNNVFSSEIIQPLLDMANPNANLGQIKYEGSPSESVNNDLPSGSSKTDSDTNLVLSLHKLATTLGLVNNSGNGTSIVGSSGGIIDSGGSQQNAVRFDKKLLDFDYSEDEDDDKSETPTEAEPPTSVALNNEDANTNPLALSMAQNLLSNPELLQRLQQMQQTIQQHQDNNSQLISGNARDLSDTSFISSFQPLIDSKAAGGSHHEMDISHVDNNVPNRDTMQPEKAPTDTFTYPQNVLSNRLNARLDPVISSGPMVHNEEPSPYQSRMDRNYSNDNKRHYDYNGPERDNDMRPRSRSRSPRRNSRFQRSSYRDKDERVKRSRSRSPWRSSNDRRNYESRSPRGNRRGGTGSERISLSPESKEREKEREKDRERRRRGLPQMKKGYLTICSTTLWLGHVPKLVSEADISNTFGEFGTINSIDLIPPRGCGYVCMNRRQDAYRALNQLKNLKLHGSTIKMAWAPGKGMKGKEYKDYWDVELGASFIPYDKLNDNVDIDLLEDGGMIDEDTVPDKLKELRNRKAKENEERMIQAAMLTQPSLIPVPSMVAVQAPVPSVPPTAAPFGMPLPTGLVPPQPPVPTAIGSSVLPVGIPPPPPVVIPGSANVPLPPVSSIVTAATSSNLMVSNDQSKPIESAILPSQPLSQFPRPTTSIAKSTVSSTSSIDSSGMMLHSGPPVFQGLSLNVPPPSVLSVQRPPPPMPWLTGPPPPMLSNHGLPIPPPPLRPPLDNSINALTSIPPGPGGTSMSIGSSPSKPIGELPSSNELRNISDNAASPKSDNDKRDDNRDSSFLSANRDPIPPPLHGDDMQVEPSTRTSTDSNDRPRDRFGRELRDTSSNKKDLFSPPHFNLNKSDRENMTGFERAHDGSRIPLHGRGSLEDHLPGSGDRFHERGHKRDWHMRGPPQGPPPASGAPGMLPPNFDEKSRNSQGKTLGGQPPPPPHSFPLGPPPFPHHDSFSVRPPPMPRVGGGGWGNREDWRGGRNNRFGGGPIGPRGVGGINRFNRAPRDERSGPPANRWTKDRHGHRIDSLRDKERDRERSREGGDNERNRERENYRERESRESDQIENFENPEATLAPREETNESNQMDNNSTDIDASSKQFNDDLKQLEPPVILNESKHSEKSIDNEEMIQSVGMSELTKMEEPQVT